MMRCKKLSSIVALVAPIAVAALLAAPVAPVEVEAASTYSDLCEVTNECIPTPRTEAVGFASDVCWDGVTVTVMGAGGCTSGRPFTLEHGFVDDPVANTVYPMLPVGDACDAGYCTVGDVDASNLLGEGAACCNPKTNVCKSIDDEDCTVGEILWCKNVEDNGDGTITCHEPS